MNAADTQANPIANPAIKTSSMKEAPGTSNKTVNAKSKKRDSIRQRIHTQIRRCHKHLWGAGSFKEHRVRRISTSSILALLTGLCLYKKFYMSPEDRLLYAAGTGNHNKVHSLLKSKIDPNSVGSSQVLSSGETNPLCAAAESGHLDAVQLLIQYKANINGQEKRKGRACTPLHWAVARDHEKVVTELIGAQADVNIPDAHGSMPVYYAHKIAIISALLNAKADINARNDSTWTPLHAAAFSFHVFKFQCVQALLDKKADVNASSRLNSTPLHLACEKGAVETVKLLLQAKANPNARDRFDITPLHLAVQMKEPFRTQMVTALLQADADPRIKRIRVRNDPCQKLTPQSMLAGDPSSAGLLLQLQLRAKELDEQEK